jgi:hypothetical protein
MKMTEKSAPTAASKTFQAPAILSRIGFTKDGGLSLGFHTNELTAADKVIASEYMGKFGWLLFKESQYTESDVPTDDPPSDEDKTPSQRLRAVLYVLWQQKDSKESFELFYRDQLERAISRVKRLLD